MKRSWNKYKKYIMILAISILCIIGQVGCIKQVPTYSENIYNKIEAIEISSNKLLDDIKGSLGSEGAKYKNYEKRYTKLKSLVEDLKIKEEKISNNENAKNQVEILSEVILKLEEAHKRAGNSGNAIGVFKEEINTIFESMKKLEISKPKS